MRVVLFGAGAVGSRAARQLASTDGVDDLVLVDTTMARAQAVAASLGSPARAAEGFDGFDGLGGRADVVVLAVSDDHHTLAEAALEAGAHVVSVSDDIAEVRSLLALDAEA